MNYSQVEEISGPSIKIDRRREEPREVRVVGISIEKYCIDIVSNEKKRIAQGCWGWIISFHSDNRKTY